VEWGGRSLPIDGTALFLQQPPTYRPPKIVWVVHMQWRALINRIHFNSTLTDLGTLCIRNIFRERRDSGNS